ncbi:hypothetical protein [Subtercola sp. RTI3]|uniref:hypothetical protein n=1 Tax=Subtercola sp. RTI3 TaxID=3048639 RepID=UPI002B2355D4|nr:hypothetical protein [Subtercola sp. RTI3]MEA9985869.1 hypothetical protein [Subtercola sp. RTI3]
MTVESVPKTSPVRVAAVPAGHSYVQNIVDREAAWPADGVTVLADPVRASTPAGQWWPPVMLDPRWVAENAHRFDLMHVHFGTESFTVSELQAVLDALRTAQRPVVFTVHDLTNPQLIDQAPHLAQLDLLIGAADEVVTLTPGAAAEVRARWGREATVIAHPRMRGAGHVVAAGAGAGSSHLAVGMHLRDLRPNIDAARAVATLIGAAAMLRADGFGVDVTVEINEKVRDEKLREELRAMTAGVAGLVLSEHPRLTDVELESALAATDIEVLPYGHGTHSGWLELCWDLGVSVAAPAVGFYGEQHTEPGAVATFTPGSVGSLAAALRLLAETRQPAVARQPTEAQGDPASALRAERAALRREQQSQIHTAHLAVYRRALAGAAR